MSDVKAIEISDILGLSEPLTKFIDTVSCGVGKLYEPTHIRRLAKAKADEISLISEAVTNNELLPISYKWGNISIDSTDANDLIQRAQNRFLFQEVKKQQNIDSVVANAYADFQGKTEVSPDPVDGDWICSFFDYVANISDEKMQVLWGKLLAGEIESPGKFSMRTLDTLRKLSQKEASIFQKIAPYVLRCKSDKAGFPDDYFLLQGDILEKYGISFPDIMAMNDAQIMAESNMISIRLIIKQGESECINGSVGKIKFTNIGAASAEISHLGYFLTTAGSELLDIVLSANEGLHFSNISYMQECKQGLLEEGISFTGAYKSLEDALSIDVVPRIKGDESQSPVP